RRCGSSPCTWSTTANRSLRAANALDRAHLQQHEHREVLLVGGQRRVGVQLVREALEAPAAVFPPARVREQRQHGRALAEDRLEPPREILHLPRARRLLES